MDETCGKEVEWSQSITVGSEAYLKKIKEALGFRARGRKIRQDEDSFELQETLTPYGSTDSDVIMAWMLMWRACIANERLQKKNKGKDQAFYQDQIFSAEYFINSVLPGSLGQMDAITGGGEAVVNIREEAFGA